MEIISHVQLFVLELKKVASLKAVNSKVEEV